MPTSRATRVTSEMKPLSWSTMSLIVFLSSSISPWTSAETFLLRSPSATAPITRCISLLGRTRSSIRLLTDSMQPPHTWSVPLKETRWESLPSLPTTRLTRSSSSPSAWFAPMISFSRSATLPAMPVQWTGMRAVKSPALTWLRTASRTSGSKLSTSVGAVLGGNDPRVRARGGNDGRAVARRRVAPMRIPECRLRRHRPASEGPRRTKALRGRPDEPAWRSDGRYWARTLGRGFRVNRE